MLFFCFLFGGIYGAVTCINRGGNDATNGAISTATCQGSETLVDCGFEAQNPNHENLGSRTGWDGAYFNGNECKARSGNWGM